MIVYMGFGIALGILMYHIGWRISSKKFWDKYGDRYIEYQLSKKIQENKDLKRQLEIAKQQKALGDHIRWDVGTSLRKAIERLELKAINEE